MSEVIRQSIRQIAGTDKPMETSIRCTVVKVQEEKMTLDAQPCNGSAKFFNVRLRAVLNDQHTGLYLIPKKDSHVIITLLDPQTAYVSMLSDIEKLCLKIDHQSLMISKDGFVFNEGKLGGFIKIEQLVEKINTIEDKLNEVIDAVKKHTHNPVPANGTAPPSTDLVGLTALAKTQRSDLEDEQVKH